MMSPRHIDSYGPIATLIVVAACLVQGICSDACCPAPPPGASVQIADQEILIVWDADSGTEHFVRRASFSTRLASFGFLVPTPTLPELGEAPDALFDRLSDAIKPQVVTERRTRLGSFLLESMTLGTRSAAPAADRSGGVRILHQQRVAGYDAVVLDADDPEALARWLQERGYDSRPTLVEWVRPYVAAKWKLTAFKLAAPDAGGSAAGARYAVRMSFRTEKPLFPFRTPTDQQGSDPAGAGGGALLRVFFVGDVKAAGSFGGKPWDATVAYADRRSDLGALLAGGLPAGESIGSGWLTTFEDGRWPRAAGDDLYFDAAPDAAPVVPPPIIHRLETMIPIEGIGAVALLAVLVVRWRWATRSTGPRP